MSAGTERTAPHRARADAVARLSRLAPPPVVRLERGVVDADGLVLDVAILGADAAWRRALQTWPTGTRLLHLPDGPWLLLWPHPAPVHAGRAAGTPVHVEAGRVIVPRHGVLHRYAVAGLPPVDPAASLALPASLRLDVLQPLEAIPPPQPLSQPDPAPRVDLAAEAGLDRGAADRARRRLQRTASSQADATRAGTPHPGLRRRGQGQGSAVAAPNLLKRWSAALAWRSPLVGLLLNRQVGYVRDLVRRFDSGALDEALRRAIALGDGDPVSSLRLPTPRTGPLAPRLGAGGPATGIAVRNLRDLLTPHYRNAAQRLEREGRWEEAAFVYADLLGSPMDAVALYERAGRPADAARLAEAHSLESGHVVRLWWAAGDRGRALRYARLRGGFETAVRLLEPVDAAAAAHLRAAWVDDDRARGDLGAAVRHAWPDPDLRRGCMPDLAVLVATGGAGAGEWAARLLALSNAPQAVDAVLRLLESDDDRTRQAGLVEALADHEAADAVTDRRVASAALRVLVRDPSVARSLGKSVGARAWKALAGRADPLVAADLRRPSSANVRAAAADVTLVAPAPGGIPIVDVALVAGGILVALGAEGVRLLTTSGKVRARWSVPATRLVVADHGHTALLVVAADHTTTVRRLDIVSGRLGPLLVLNAAPACDSYDGRLMVTIRDGALEFVDVTGARPAVVWRELGAPERALLVARDSSRLTAILMSDADPSAGLELRQWSVGDLLTRERTPLGQCGPGLQSWALGDGHLLTLEHHWAGGWTLSSWLFGSPRLRTLPRSSQSMPDTVAHSFALHQAGSSAWLAQSTPDAVRFWPLAGESTRLLNVVDPGPAQARVVMPGPPSVPAVRTTSAGTVMADGRGRVVALTAKGAVIASFVVTE